MLVSAVQTDVVFADPIANRNRMIGWIESARDRSIELAVFPECVLTGYGFESRDTAMQAALSLADPVIQTLVEAAEQCRVAITFGFLERDENHLFNSAVAIGPAQADSKRFEIRSHYRKIHLPKMGADRFVDRGNRPYRVDSVGQANVGLAICYDCSFPEPMRVLGLHRADIVALGTNWPVAAARTAEIVPPARSMENHYYFIAANRVGSESGFRFCGMSSICGPDGVICAKTDTDQETMVVADIDLEIARSKRIERTVGTHAIDRFADRRPEFYGPVSELNG
jgi:5-aminopentanamidase